MEFSEAEAVEEYTIWNKYELKSKSKRERRSIYLIWFIVLSIIIFGVGGLLFFSYYYSNRCYTNYKVISEVERSDSNNVTYEYFQKNILKYSGSGISLIDASGKPIWNGGYEMKQAQVDTCEGRVIAADIGGKSFYVYSGQDEGVGLETSYPIVRAKVAAQGVAAVLEQESDSNTLKLYNPYSNGTKLLAEIPTVVADDGYPMDFDISPDGATVVASYLVPDGTNVKTQVNFYNFSEVGQDYNMLVGGKEYAEEVISQIVFLSGDRVALFRESGYDVFSNMKQPDLKYEKSYDDTVLSFAYSEDYVAVVTTDASGDKKTLHVYDLDGRIELEKEINYEYTDVKIYDDEIFFFSAHRVDILRLNGYEKFACDFDLETDGIFPSGNSVEYILVDYNNIRKIRLLDK